MQTMHSTATREGATSTKTEKLPAAFLNFPDLPDDAFVRLRVVVLLDASSPATIWRKARNGIFPAPVKLGEKSTGWNVGALRRHYAALTARSENEVSERRDNSIHLRASAQIRGTL